MEGSSWRIRDEDNGLDTNFGGKIETEHEGSRCRLRVCC